MYTGHLLPSHTVGLSCMSTQTGSIYNPIPSPPVATTVVYRACLGVVVFVVHGLSALSQPGEVSSHPLLAKRLPTHPTTARVWGAKGGGSQNIPRLVRRVGRSRPFRKERRMAVRAAASTSAVHAARCCLCSLGCSSAQCQRFYPSPNYDVSRNDTLGCI